MGNKNTAVTFIITRPDNSVLMQLRDDGGGKQVPYPDKWCFPGGTKENNEDYIDCVIREAKEEYDLNLNKEKCMLIHVYDHDNTTNDHVFLCRIEDKQEPILREGAAMAWKRLTGIKDLDLAWVQKEIIPILEKHLK